MQDLFPLKGVWNKKLHADKFIKRIKIAVKKNNTTFDLVSSYLISAIKNKFFKVIRLLRMFDLSGKEDVTYKFFSIFNEVIFFIYAMDFRVRQTYIISQVILEVNSFANEQASDISEVIKKNTFDELLMCMKSMGNIHDKPVELSNLLICMKGLGEQYKLNPDEFKDLLGVGGDECFENLEYFSICSILHYIDDDVLYLKMKEDIVLAVQGLISGRNDIKKDTETFMLLLDMITCPYLTVKHKRKIYKAYVEATTGKKRFVNAMVDSEIDCLKNNIIFFNWSGDADLEHVLYKKELRTAYE